MDGGVFLYMKHAMDLDTFLEFLEARAYRELEFYAPGGLVPGDYHITEVKHAAFTRVDCGGQAESGAELVLQLLPAAGGRAMSAGKAAGILRQALSHLDAGAATSGHADRPVGLLCAPACTGRAIACARSS
jgi:hypothetical protein